MNKWIATTFLIGPILGILSGPIESKIICMARKSDGSCLQTLELPSPSSRSDYRAEGTHLKIVAEGSFFTKSLRESGTNEAAAGAAAICAAFGADCSREALVYKVVVSSVTKKNEEWWGKFYPSSGYEVCKARLVSGGPNPGSTFNVVVQPDGLGFYAVVPENRPEGHWVDVDVELLTVPSGTRGSHDCYALNSHPWLCSGNSCSCDVPGNCPF